MRTLRGNQKKAIDLYCFLVILYHFVYASGLFSWLGITIGGIHPALSVGMVMAILFLHLPFAKKMRQDQVPWYDFILAVACLVPTLYYAYNFEKTLYSALTPSTVEVALGVLMVVLCFEGVRRAIGLPLVVCGFAFLMYPLVAEHLPGILFAAPVKFYRLIGDIYLGTQGFFAAGAQVFSTTIVTFVIFGQLINISGGADFYLDISLAAMGGRNGGPAKAATVGSGLFGMISGVAVANVVTTGSITIPMMKRKGYSPEFAGAVETVASTGGAIMPPVMGVLAFIMADYLAIPYWQIAAAGIIPGVLYYVAVFLQVSFHSNKHKLGGLDKDEVPNAGATLKKGWPFILPLATMVFLFARFGWDAMRVGFAVCILVMMIHITNQCLLGKKSVKEPAKDFYKAFAKSGVTLANIMPAACLAGIIMASVNMTAIGLRLSAGLLGLSGGNLFILLILCGLCCLLMGVAVDLIVIYIIMAVMIAPAMVSLGVVPLAAHLFILYYTVVGLITPPVCVATYAASSIAESRPFKTAWHAMRLGFVAMVIPFVFAYKPSIILQGGGALETVGNTIFALGAIVALSAVFQKYFFRRSIGLVEMALFAACGVALLLNHSVVNAVGLAALAVLIAAEVLAIRRDKNRPVAAAGSRRR